MTAIYKIWPRLLGSASAVLFISLLASCSQTPKNKVGKAYDANSARCIWGDGHAFKDPHRQLFDETGHKDHFEQTLEQQESDRRIDMDCESWNDYQRRRNKTNLKAEINKALAEKGK